MARPSSDCGHGGVGAFPVIVVIGKDTFDYDALPSLQLRLLLARTLCLQVSDPADGFLLRWGFGGIGGIGDPVAFVCG